MLTRVLLTCVVLLLSPYVCFADFSGPVVSVLDGDTIDVSTMAKLNASD